MAYRNNIERYDLSSEAFLRFVTDVPGDDRVPEAYYFLYLNAKDQNDLGLAQRYASVLQDKFPTTKYAMIAADPGYLKKLEAQTKTIDVFYDETYLQFDKGNYAISFAAFDEAKQAYGKSHPYIAKFALLRAMSVGKLQGKDEYVDELRSVVAQYPNTPEQIRAREIIRFLGGDADAFSKGFDSGFTVSTFKVEEDKLHYVVVVLYNSDIVKLDEAKIAINDYNGLFHKLDRLQIRSFTVDREKEIPAVLIRKFDNKKKAMEYYTEVNGRMDKFLPAKADAEVYPISQHNYREMVKAGGIDSYKSFFTNNYLN